MGDERLQTVKSNQVVLFMKGIPAAPRCGFSNMGNSYFRNSVFSFREWSNLSSNRNNNSFNLNCSIKYLYGWLLKLD